MSARTIVIGYGNELRGDDAVGVRVAQAVEALNLPDVETVLLHQLTLEVSATIAPADIAVFVDACAEPSLKEVRVRSIQPASGFPLSTHSSDPSDLLWLAHSLYHSSVKVWAVDIPASEFGIGTQLSPRTAAAVEKAVARIGDLVVSCHRQIVDGRENPNA